MMQDPQVESQVRAAAVMQDSQQTHGTFSKNCYATRRCCCDSREADVTAAVESRVSTRVLCVVRIDKRSTTFIPPGLIQLLGD